VWTGAGARFNEVRRRFRRFREALVQSGQVQQGSRVPEKVWEALVQSQVRFNRVPKKAPEKVPVKVWEGLVQSQVSFNRVSEKFPEKGPGGFGAEPGQVQQGSGEGSGEGLGGYWWKATSGSTGSGEGCGKGGFGNLWCRARSGSTGSAEGFQPLASQHTVQKEVFLE